MQNVLSVGGSDPSGGAGVQADVRTLSACGVHPLSVIALVTAQNTLGVRRAEPVPAELLLAQLESVFEDFALGAIKTGALGSPGHVELLADLLRPRGVPLVVDPVDPPTRGTPLSAPGTREAFARYLFPIAAIVTPTAREAELLSGIVIRNDEDAINAGKKILTLGCQAVLVKGGHLEATKHPVDVLVTRDAVERMELPARIGVVAHGTGCALASAIAASLARGFDLRTSVLRAQWHVLRSLELHHFPGRGAPQLDPFHAHRKGMG